MSAITHIRFYPSDWLAGTRGMTAAETGVYITLIAMMYERVGPIRCDDMAKLSRLCGTSASALKGILGRLIDDGKITRDGDLLSNRRVELEIKNTIAKSEVARDKAKARWSESSIKSTDDECCGNAAAMLTNSHKVIDKEKTPSLRSGVQKKPAQIDLLQPSPGEIDDTGQPPLPDDQPGKPKQKSKPPPKPPPDTARGTRLPENWHPGSNWLDFTQKEGLSDGDACRALDEFRDYWRGKPGKDGLKCDWLATWRNRVRSEATRAKRFSGSTKSNGGRYEPPSLLGAYQRAADRFRGSPDLPGGGGFAKGDDRGLLELPVIRN